MTEQLFQIGIKGLIRNPAGEILLVRIAARKERSAYWDLPGGRMKPGETFLDTLHRELQEEIGITYTGNPRQLTSVLTAATIPVGAMNVPLVLTTYLVDVPDHAHIQLDPQSTEESFAWFTPAEAAEQLRATLPETLCGLVADL